MPLRGLILFLWFAVWNAAVFAQTESVKEDTATETIATATIELTADIVEARRKAAESSDLDEEGKKRAAEIYRQAAEQIQSATTFTARTKDFETRAEKAAERVKELKAESDALQPKLAAAAKQLEQLNERLKDPRFVPTEELNQLQQERAANESILKKTKEELAKVESTATNRVGRRKDARARLAVIEKELSDVNEQLAAPPPAGENPTVTQAKKTELLARKQLLVKEQPALEAELKMFDAEDAVDKVRAERDLKTQQVALDTTNFQLADLLLKRKQDVAARERVRSARDDLNEYSSSSLLKPLAERNFELSELNQEKTGQLREVEKVLATKKRTLDELRGQFENAKKKVDSIGMPASMGTLLRKRRSDLAAVRVHPSSIRERQPKIEAAELLSFDLDEERSQLANPEKAIEQYLARDEFRDIPPDDIAAELETAKTLLARRQEFLDPLLKTQNNYFEALAELSFTERQINQQADDFAEYIDERVLWIRSGSPLIDELRNEGDWQQTYQSYTASFARIVNPKSWAKAGLAIFQDAESRPILYVICLFLFGLLTSISAQCRRQIRTIGEQVQHSAFSQFSPTVKAAALTVCIAVQWPLLIAFLGWRLYVSPGNEEFIAELSRGLWIVALGYLSLELFRQMCRPRGLAEAHFEWSDALAGRFRRNIRWLEFFGLPIVLLTSVARADTIAPGRISVERLFFIIGTILFSFFLAQLIHPERGIFKNHMTANPTGWISRLRYVWYGTAVASPLFLAGLAVLGYSYTGQQLAWRLYWTIVLIAFFSLLHAMINRLLLVHRRRLSIEQARQRRAAAVAAAQQSASTSDASALPPDTPSLEESMADLRTQTSQTRRLVTTAIVGATFVAMWLTWSDVVPALGFLERWPLWTSTTQNTKPITDELGNTVMRITDEIDPVTIADVTFGIFIAVMTIVAARNLPGLLEIAVLQQLPLETSVRYAITTLCSYGISMAGLVVACSMIGLHWNQVQWMATALTFGLAFGLQEMFANFVAGIIILFERPIRVGDIVTIEDITGVVSRVRIRATTITNWDRKDYVVPNKDFITGRVLNWTLSDQVNRIVVNVGVAYGSDTALAKLILVKIARDHPQIVDEPAPSATFEEFGDSSLLIVLRCFIAMRDMPSRLKIVDELHSTIDAEFKAANIEIAFPQQDLHIRSIANSNSVESTNAVLLSKETGNPSKN